MQLQSRATVFAAIGAMLALMGAFVLYAETDKPGLGMVRVSLDGVEVVSQNPEAGEARVRVSLLVENPSDKTFTVPLIEYDLYADGVRLGSGSYSTEDIAMPGRAPFHAGASIPLDSTLTVHRTEENAGAYGRMASGPEPEYEAAGVITVETSWSILEKRF